jgi:hypothetical protein
MTKTPVIRHFPYRLVKLLQINRMVMTMMTQVVMTTTWTSTIYRSPNKEKAFACLKFDIHPLLSDAKWI